VVVRKRLHGLLDKLVALILEALAVAKLARVDTATEVVVLRRRRRGPVTISGCDRVLGLWNVPVAICRHNIINLELLRDLLNAQMKRVSVKLLRSHGRVDSCRQAHKTSGLILASISPSVALLALSGTIGSCKEFVRVRL
jgi:hypothetical protein